MTDAVSRLSTALEGRYAVERELGAGGMATVYLAEDVKHHRQFRGQGRLDPRWDPIRNQPRFKALLARYPAATPH